MTPDIGAPNQLELVIKVLPLMPYPFACRDISDKTGLPPRTVSKLLQDLHELVKKVPVNRSIGYRNVYYLKAEALTSNVFNQNRVFCKLTDRVCMEKNHDCRTCKDLSRSMRMSFIK